MHEILESPPPTLAAYVGRLLEEHATLPFLRDPSGRAVTYGEADAGAERVAALLRDRGIKPGDRVALLGPNGINWCLVYLAAIRAGFVIVPILPDFAPAGVHNIINMSGARAAFVSSSLLDKMERGLFPELHHLFLLDDFSPVAVEEIRDLPLRLKGRLEHVRERAQAFLAEHVLPGHAAASSPQAGDLAAILYTSGTTGSSKGVMLTQGNLMAAVLAAISYVRVTPADRLLSLLPLAHTYECTCGFLGPMYGGASIHFLGQKPSPKALLAAFQKVKPTLVFAVPLVIDKIYRKRVCPTIETNRLLRVLIRFPAARRAVYRRAVASLMTAFGGSLRQMGFGGAPLNPEVERFLREGKFPYYVGYGMTECAPLICGCRPEETRSGSCGYPVRGIELRLADIDAATGIGEVQVRGPMVTQGYHKNPDATRDLFTADGWMRTGDLGRQDDDGHVYLKGRSKNVIVGSSGENIYPEEIEQLLARSSLVTESLVGLRDGRLEALIVPDYDLLTQELRLWGLDDGEAARRVDRAFHALLDSVNRELPSFARLTGFRLSDKELDKTPTQKIKRYLYG